jgi:hypothetical protein
MARLVVGASITIAVAAAAALAAPSATGTWMVTTAGAVATRCSAEVTQAGGQISGQVRCPKLGMSLPFDGRVTESGAVGTARDVTWTAVRAGEELMGSYGSPLGSGTWVAVRR